MLPYARLLQREDNMATPHQPTPGARRALKKLGIDIRDARKRRRLTMSIIADRAATSRQTLSRVEVGDPSVSMGIYAAVLQALGLLDGLADIADPASDIIGQDLSNSRLPKRVRVKTNKGGSIRE